MRRLDFPGAAYDEWKTTEPVREPDHVEECDGCGKHFEPDHDNERGGRWGHFYFVCDRCLQLGWPFGRDHKDCIE
jgi:hypothetical protein